MSKNLINMIKAASKLMRKLKQYPVIELIIIFIFIFLAIFAPLLTPYSPYQNDLPNRLSPPFWQEGGSMAHPLGTDELGRDILCRTMYGGRLSLLIAFVTVAIGGGIGVIIGIIAGYFRGNTDVLLMRVTDIFLGFPLVLLALLFAVIAGPSFQNVIIAISLTLWARYARVIRGEVLVLREQNYVALAKVSGASSYWISLRHILPNVMNTTIVLLSLQVGWVILTEATLSFLGAGIPPPYPAWGSMIASGRNYLSTSWWVSGIPSIAIVVLALSFNLIGDWIREALDPKLREIMVK